VKITPFKDASAASARSRRWKLAYDNKRVIAGNKLQYQSSYMVPYHSDMELSNRANNNEEIMRNESYLNRKDQRENSSDSNNTHARVKREIKNALCAQKGAKNGNE
jgi:hypothetical protein